MKFGYALPSCETGGGAASAEPVVPMRSADP